MTAAQFQELLEDSPLIAAVKDDAGMEQALRSGSKIIFLLYGTVCSIVDLVKQVKNADRQAIVHMDLISGLSAKETAVEFIQKATSADGIISTRPPLIRRAKELGLLTIQRFFLLDSMSLDNVLKSREGHGPDFIEILPGVMPRIIARICREVKEPVIAGGLIDGKEDVLRALSAGAAAISTTKKEVWFL